MVSAEPCTIRLLTRDDYDNGYLQCLKELTAVGDISKQQFEGTPWLSCHNNAERLSLLQDRQDTYKLLVAVDNSQQVVGCGTLLLEHKFIHSCGVIGHIEDVVVGKALRGQGLGAK